MLAGFINILWTILTLSVTTAVIVAVLFALTWSVLGGAEILARLLLGRRLQLSTLRPVMVIKELAQQTSDYVDEVREVSLEAFRHVYSLGYHAFFGSNGNGNDAAPDLTIHKAHEEPATASAT